MQKDSFFKKVEAPEAEGGNYGFGGGGHWANLHCPLHDVISVKKIESVHLKPLVFPAFSPSGICILTHVKTLNERLNFG